IHFDIPWSLIRIEQRNGRIDRYGQRHRPQITTLLLQPDSERFSGDVRVLTRLVEKEHEAHRALGDSASLMGKYNVDAEEKAITDVPGGRDELDEVIQDVEAVSTGGDVAAMFARLTQQPAAPSDTSSDPLEDTLFAGDLDYLEQALDEVFE